MTKVIAKTYGTVSEYRIYISYTLIAGSLALALFYALSMYSIISRTVATQKLETEMAKLADNVRNLDVQYIALSSRITPAMMKEYNLHESGVSAYIPRTRSLSSLHVVAREM